MTDFERAGEFRQLPNPIDWLPTEIKDKRKNLINNPFSQGVVNLLLESLVSVLEAEVPNEELIARVRKLAVPVIRDVYESGNYDLADGLVVMTAQALGHVAAEEWLRQSNVKAYADSSLLELAQLADEETISIAA